MLEHTFLHLPGVTPQIERRLWRLGVLDWQAFMSATPGTIPLAGDAYAEAAAAVEDSVTRLEAGDAAWFGQRLPEAEHWRAVPDFGHRLLFFDIETDGGMGGDSVTVVGVYDGSTVRQYVRDRDLHEAVTAFADADILVTFFGSGFDVPLLRRALPDVILPPLHVDLCHALRRVGLRGGLKRIEQLLGIARSRVTAGMGGREAVHLWREYEGGSKRALDRLLQYNSEDIVNLAPLLRAAIPMLVRHAGFLAAP